RVGPGVQELPIDVKTIDSRARIVDVNPSKAIVRLEQIKKKDVPVRVAMRGELPAGYRAQAAKTTPDTVSVTGPATRVDPVAAAVADVDLSVSTACVHRVYMLCPRKSS